MADQTHYAILKRGFTVLLQSTDNGWTLVPFTMPPIQDPFHELRVAAEVLHAQTAVMTQVQRRVATYEDDATRLPTGIFLADVRIIAPISGRWVRREQADTLHMAVYAHYEALMQVWGEAGG